MTLILENGINLKNNITMKALINIIILLTIIILGTSFYNRIRKTEEEVLIERYEKRDVQVIRIDKLNNHTKVMYKYPNNKHYVEIADIYYNDQHEVDSIIK